MNEALIANWNSVVNPDDIVLHVGDFAMGPKERWSEVRARLNGRIVLHRGNHDKDAAFMLSIGIDEVWENRVHLHNGVSLYLNHFPEFGEKKADFHLYGHVHDKTPDNQPKWARNMSVEVIGYTPMLLDQVIADFSSQ